MDEQAADHTGADSRKKRRNLIWFGGLGGLALAAVVLAATLGGGSTGNPAPDFSFALYQGQGEIGASSLNLSDLKGRPVVLNFWAGLCPPCRAEMPDLQLFHNDFKDKVTLVGIDLGRQTGLGGQNDAVSLLNLLEVTYPAGFTDDASVVQQYEVLAMPTTVFINSRGEVFRKWGGLLTVGVLTDVTNEMLAAG
jgi:thiol-disulfide isomerase/thioredoxin